jgi:hypothetical protein
MWNAANMFTPDQQIETELGREVCVDLERLIGEVDLAPDAKAPLSDVVQGLLDQAGLKLTVKQSGINAPLAW